MEPVKVFEIGAEGGALTMWRRNINGTDYYSSDNFFAVDEYISEKNSGVNTSQSFAQEFIKINSKYPNILSLYPLFVDKNYANVIIQMLRDYQLNKDLFVDIQQWSQVLNVEIDKILVDNPTYSLNEYYNLKNKYSNVSSWAIWNDSEHRDTLIIEQNIGKLNSRFVGVGLNISNPVSEWSNFRGTNCRKLHKTFNNGRLKGFYLTDILKNIIDVNSSNIEKKLKKNEIDLESHISYFKQEMKDIKITKETCFLVFGNLAFELFKKHLQPSYPDNKIIKLRHYSARGTDKLWIKEALDKIGVFEEYIENGTFTTEYFNEMDKKKPTNYREHLINVINNLIELETSTFTDLINVAMSNEYKEIDESFEIGEEFNFDLSHFEKSNDQNVQKLVNLVKEIRSTVETLMNINNIKESDR